jgi:hypothetical protein
MDSGTEQKSNGANKDARGRFLPGNQAAKGRRRSRIAAARQILAEEISPTEVAKAIRKLYDLGMAGNPGALKDFLDRVGLVPFKDLGDVEAAEDATPPARIVLEYRNGEESKN